MDLEGLRHWNCGHPILITAWHVYVRECVQDSWGWGGGGGGGARTTCLRQNVSIYML